MLTIALESGGPVSPPPSHCDFPRRLKLQRDGSYLAGPCHAAGSDIARGNISAESLQRITTYADMLAENDLSSPQTCNAFTDLGRLSVDLGFETGTGSRIYEVRADTPLSCYRGQPDTVRALATELQTLQQQVYDQAFGG